MPMLKTRREGMPYSNPRNQSFSIEIDQIPFERMTCGCKSMGRGFPRGWEQDSRGSGEAQARNALAALSG